MTTHINKHYYHISGGHACLFMGKWCWRNLWENPKMFFWYLRIKKLKRWNN